MSPPLAWKMVLVAVAQFFAGNVQAKCHFLTLEYFISSQKCQATISLHHVIMSVIIVNYLHFTFLALSFCFFNKQNQMKHFSLARACSIKSKFLRSRFQARILWRGEKKCVCWFKNNGKKQHKRPQVSSHLSCKTSADRTVWEFFHYPLNGPEDDYKKQPEEHGNHCSANEDNELQICFLFSAWEEINEYLSDSWKHICFVHSLK